MEDDSNPANQQERIAQAIQTLEQHNLQQTDGQWLEQLTVQIAPIMKDWDISQCWAWSDWPNRESNFPGSTTEDVGIDAVATRRSDGAYIAIQCKSRRLDENGNGPEIPKSDIDSFASSSSSKLFAERWLITNGNCPLGRKAQILTRDKPIKEINITADVWQEQLDRKQAKSDECPHCLPNPDEEERIQTRACMQDETVRTSVRLLREHRGAESGGLPKGQARGRIILPCGSGKTRVSLRIVEELTPQGKLSVVLCPSIALVAQIRREYLQHANRAIRVLAVCSDQTAGYDPAKEGSRNTAKDPTLDNSNVSASEVKGKVTTDANEIAEWITQSKSNEEINIIFGTYQSSHKLAEALKLAKASIEVLIADEAHRTAGIKKRKKSEEDQRVRDFTICHDQERMPATYRVYQTATPRVYQVEQRKSKKLANDWIVRSMDDVSTFGVELYRKSYVEAVKNGWLSDYRIIALGIATDAETSRTVGELVRGNVDHGDKLKTPDYLRGLSLALAMAGATNDQEAVSVPLTSCIAFMNTVAKSEKMAHVLQTQVVKDWVRSWWSKHKQDGSGQPTTTYRLEHLDAKSNVMAREKAKAKLATATEESPFGVINVGIFGEGTDAPALNAVAFLEPRKSPIDVIQAVGRAMRVTSEKDVGYIICPILFPAGVDPETWLSTSNPEEGWQELGQILLALRAHDNRIEDKLSDLFQLYLPQQPAVEHSLIAIADAESGHIKYGQHKGGPGQAQKAVERVLKGESSFAKEVAPLPQPQPSPDKPPSDTQAVSAPQRIITGKKNKAGQMDLRNDTVVREKASSDSVMGQVNIPKSKKRAKDMINKGEGLKLKATKPTRERRTATEAREGEAAKQLSLIDIRDYGEAIKMNLLSKSGLNHNRTLRDFNMLEATIREAARYLREDELASDLDRHFGLDNLEKPKGQRADGCTVCALLIMNAAMLHQRISNGSWLPGINNLGSIKGDPKIIRQITRQWERISNHDFLPILVPALNAIYTIEESGRVIGLEKALAHITAEAEQLAELYADMGADHAGPLFNRVMGDQSSDGAFFTKPTAAAIAARLALDAWGEAGWSSEESWKAHKIVDLACGSGTLLAAVLADMKRRAQRSGADDKKLSQLQKVAVEEVLKGLDINAISLQLAASQLTGNNQNIRYKKMGLHLMPYGPGLENSHLISTGTIELLGHSAILPRGVELALDEASIKSDTVWSSSTADDDIELEDAVTAAKDASIVIMNPPFTERSKMGAKFPQDIQKKLRDRVDDMEQILLSADSDAARFSNRRTQGTLFVALADLCARQNDGVVVMIHPTIALTTISGLGERQILAQRFHIHTILTSHQPKNLRLTLNTTSQAHESIIVMRRHPANEPKPPTRFVSLDKMPVDEHEVEALYNSLCQCRQGPIPNDWGEVSHWPAEYTQEGDWGAAAFRSPALAIAIRKFATHINLQTITQLGYVCYETRQEMRKSKFVRDESGSVLSFPILSSSGADSQKTICSTPDQAWQPTNSYQASRQDKLLEKAGFLLITGAQNTATARLTAVASDCKYVGRGWLPITGPNAKESKAIAVFFNSTAGRLQLLSNAGRDLAYPLYNPGSYKSLRIPNVQDEKICRILADCWEQTRATEVPQFRDGECEVRALWDKAVATAMDWDEQELTGLRQLLHNEPHIRQSGYHEYADEVEHESSI